MKTITPLVLAVATLFLCTEALAVKRQVNLSPHNLKSAGFAVEMAERDDGAIDVTVTRDLSKARSFDAGSDLELVRSATLEVVGSAGVVVRCNLEPEAGADSVTYKFMIARDHLPHSRLTVSEIDDYKKTMNRPHLIGGGTFFEINLADFDRP